MLRLYFVQLWYNFSDEGTEDALYDMPLLARFVDIDLTSELVTDSTTQKNFCHLLEENELAPKILDQINALLADKGLMLREGNIVDATLIAASPSTKNKDKTHDSEMHQTKKGNEWHFGMKMHIGADVNSGLTHTTVGSAANVSEFTMAGQLLRSDDKIFFAAAGYTGAAKRPENAGKDVDWRVARKRGQVMNLPEGEVKGQTQYAERLKARVRARVEHPFHNVKNLFGHRKPAIAAMRRTKANGKFCSLWPTYMTRKR